MRIEEAEVMARRLMDEHGLTDWTFGFDRAKTRAGQCRYGRKAISLSRPLTARHDEAEVRDTVLHEIAHALAGPRAGHGPRWRAKALAIGCSGSRCSSPDAPRVEGDWRGVCPSGHETTAHRRPRRVRSCGRCSNGFDPTTVLTWTYRGLPAVMHPDYVAELRAVQARVATSWAGALPDLPEPRPAAPARQPQPRPTLPVGTTVRLLGTGRWAGVTGEVVKHGRTRYHVRTGDHVVTAPVPLVEALPRRRT